MENISISGFPYGRLMSTRRVPKCRSGRKACGRVCLRKDAKCHVIKRGSYFYAPLSGSRGDPFCHPGSQRCPGGYCIPKNYICGGRPRRGPKAGVKRRTPRYCGVTSRRCGRVCVARSRKCHKAVVYA